MSGINGFNWADQIIIKKMNEDIKHRGNACESIFVDNFISLGNTRHTKTSLIENRNQPLNNYDKSLWITFDGTIFNLSTLIQKEESSEHIYNLKTYPEIILYFYEKYGPKFFGNLNGIFAFCIYDNKNKCLYLVRDRIGAKPLYYYFNNEKFIFSSEIKAFRIFKEITFCLDNNSVLQYFLTRNISDESFFSEIKTVSPGHYIKFDLINHKIISEKFFDIYKNISEEKYLQNKNKQVKELVNELDTLLNKAVKDQIATDGSLGAICSGGVDSSLLSAIAKKYDKNLKLFNVKVDDEFLDESIYSKKVAKHLGLDLIEEELNRKKFIELYKKCIFLLDLPLIHPCSVGIHLISKRVKDENVNFLLIGEGADELFGGYDHYRFFYRRLFLMKNPIFKFLNKKIRNLVYFENFTNFMLEDSNYLMNRYKYLPWNKNRRNAIVSSYNALSFLDDNFEREMASYILKDFKHYLPPTLWEADRMTMGAGLEMRMPFLDNRIVDFALNLPLKYKVSFFKTKYLLKKVAERYLPKDIVYRKKMGFGIPTEKWLGDEDLDFKRVMYDDWEKIFFCH